VGRACPLVVATRLVLRAPLYIFLMLTVTPRWYLVTTTMSGSVRLDLSVGYAHAAQLNLMC
jgi:hypothetical protein